MPPSIVSIGSHAFQHTGLRSVVIPETVTSFDTEAAFAGCSALRQAEINAMTATPSSVCCGMFTDADSLQALAISSSFTVHADGLEGTVALSAFEWGEDALRCGNLDQPWNGDDSGYLLDEQGVCRTTAVTEFIRASACTTTTTVSTDTSSTSTPTSVTATTSTVTTVSASTVTVVQDDFNILLTDLFASSGGIPGFDPMTDVIVLEFDPTSPGMGLRLGAGSRHSHRTPMQGTFTVQGSHAERRSGVHYTGHWSYAADSNLLEVTCNSGESATFSRYNMVFPSPAPQNVDPNAGGSCVRGQDPGQGGGGLATVVEALTLKGSNCALRGRRGKRQLAQPVQNSARLGSVRSTRA